MKNNTTQAIIRHALFLLMIAFVLLAALISCTPDMDVGNNTELADQFMDHVIADDYNAAYGIVKATVSDPDFRDYWNTIRLVAEGAETKEQVDFLREAGCDFIQGYYYSKPLPQEEFAKLLDEQCA